MSSPIQNNEMNTGMITSRTPGATVAVRMSRGGGDADVMVRELPPSAKYFRRQGIIRYSYSSLGCKDDSWVDATEAFCRDLEGLIRCRKY